MSLLRSHVVAAALLAALLGGLLPAEGGLTNSRPPPARPPPARPPPARPPPQPIVIVNRPPSRPPIVVVNTPRTPTPTASPVATPAPALPPTMPKGTAGAVAANCTLGGGTLVSIPFPCNATAPRNSSGADKAVMTELLDLIDNIEEVQATPFTSLQPGWTARVPVCTWAGVVCYQDVAIGVILSSETLAIPIQGNVSRILMQLAKLPDLQYVILRNQTLHGQLPPAFARASPKLRELDLINSTLTGLIPDSWAWEEIEHIYLRDNNFARLPAWNTSGPNFSKLQRINLGNASQGGTLKDTESWPHDMPKLVRLVLDRNNLEGPLPEQYSNFTALQYAFLDNNRLNGTLPAAWGRKGAWRNLTVFNLDTNHLTGTLPPEWSAGFANLDTLSIQNNRLEGPIPLSWARNASSPGPYPQLSLMILTPGNGGLCGNTRGLPVMPYDATVIQNWFDSSFEKLFRDTSQDLGGRLTSLGACAPSHGDNKANYTAAEVDVLLKAVRPAFRNFDAVANATDGFTGWNSSVPVCNWSYVSCDYDSRVTNFTASGSNLTGSVSDSLLALAQLPRLESIDLSNNSLAGELPGASFSSQAQSLIGLDASNNNISGVLPADWNFTFLSTLYLAGNSLLKGELSPSWGASGASMKYLRDLQIYNCSLTGPLPQQWASGQLPSLWYVDLSTNKLNGTLPASWRNLTYLAHLDVSNNKLSGTLPPAWGDAEASNATLSSLGWLGIENNSLTGPLPSEWCRNQGMAGLRILNAAGNNLAGQIPASYAIGNSTATNSACFPKLKRMDLRPGNQQLCGPVPLGVFVYEEAFHKGVFADWPENIQDDPTCGIYQPSGRQLDRVRNLGACPQ